MDDPNDVAEAFAETAKKVVDDSQGVAVAAFDKINGTDPQGNPLKFTAGDAIKSMAALAKIAVTGGIELGQTALEVQPTKGVLDPPGPHRHRPGQGSQRGGTGGIRGVRLDR